MGVKTDPSSRPQAPSAPATRPMKRRGLGLGAGTAGAAAIAVQLLPGAVPATPAGAVAKAASSEPDAGGYRLSDHVRRYYETTRS